jgi:hypothetical protein
LESLVAINMAGSWDRIIPWSDKPIMSHIAVGTRIRPEGAGLSGRASLQTG